MRNALLLTLWPSKSSFLYGITSQSASQPVVVVAHNLRLYTGTDRYFWTGRRLMTDFWCVLSWSRIQFKLYVETRERRRQHSLTTAWVDKVVWPRKIVSIRLRNEQQQPAIFVNNCDKPTLSAWTSLIHNNPFYSEPPTSNWLANLLARWYASSNGSNNILQLYSIYISTEDEDDSFKWE